MPESQGPRNTSSTVTVSDGDFDETVGQFPLMVVDCWAPWCGPCVMIAPVIEELAVELSGRVAFGKLNTDENPETATRFGIMAIPTLLVFRNGYEVDRIIGVVPKNQILQKLRKYL